MLDVNEIKYVNTENWELLTTKQLQDFYKDVVIKENEYYHDSFDNWLKCCMTRNNGSLDEVTKLTETFYKRKDGTCYSIDGSMVCNNVNSELSDIYYDYGQTLDIIALDMDTHTFEELMDNYYLREDDLNKDEITKCICLVYEKKASLQALKDLVQIMIDSTFFE